MTEQTRIGKLTVAHIQALLEFVPILVHAKPELAVDLTSHPDKAGQLFKPGLAWGDQYDLSLEDQLASFMKIAGLTDYVNAANKSSDPMSEMMKLDKHPDYQEWNGGADKLYAYHKLLGALYALIGTFECLILYGYYINEFVAIASEQNNDAALFIDPAINC